MEESESVLVGAVKMILGIAYLFFYPIIGMFIVFIGIILLPFKILECLFSCGSSMLGDDHTDGLSGAMYADEDGDDY